MKTIIFKIQKSVSGTNISIQSNIEAIAIQITIPIKLYICNVYLPKSRDFDQCEIKNLIRQLPTPFLLLGDFNARNTTWGDHTICTRRKKISEILENPNLFILNNRSFTHFSIAHNSFS